MNVSNMKLNNLLGGIILVGIIVSVLEWISIENLWMAILVMIATVVFSSFLYLKLSNVLLNIDMSTSEFVKELFKIITVMLILLSPIICFGRIILFEEEISNPEIIIIAYILIPIIFLTLVNMIEFSPSIRKLKPITAQEILNALRQLERKLNVHIDNIYLLDRGLDGAEVNAYLIGLKIQDIKRLLSPLKTE